MKYLYDLKEKLCDELEKIAKKQDMTAGDLEMAHKLTDTIKNIEKIMMLEDGYHDDGYSGDGQWRANMEGNYGHGSSYARRRDRLGRYSGTRDYSMDGDDMISDMEDLMHDAKNDRQRKAIERCIREMRG